MRDGKVKEFMLLEGVRLCEEAARAGVDITVALFTEAARSTPRAAAVLAMLTGGATQIFAVSDDVLFSVSDTKTPQGIVALARRPTDSAQPLVLKDGQTPLVVILHQLNNPANAGALLRAAEAAGATGAIATAGTTDLFSPKALRGAMGSTFRLPLWTGASFAAVLDWCVEQRVSSVSTHARAAQLHTELDWTVPRAVIVGPEGAGLTAEEVGAAKAGIRIPMRPPVESLNAAVALGIILYEAARQRGWPR